MYLARALATLFVWGAVFGCVWAINFGSQHYESPGAASVLTLLPACAATMAIWWEAVDKPCGVMVEESEEDEDSPPANEEE